jgi:sugar O-acyltransferase (sialic acid O-acetyltransferase NeuD family)
MRRLLVVGAGGHGVVVADAAEASQGWSHIIFVDDAYPGVSKVVDWDVVGDSGALRQLRQDIDAAVVAVGNNYDRLSLLAAVEQADIPLATIIHPRASVSGLSEIGDGTVLLANVAVNARTKIGKGCVINTAATVDHDCRLADGVHIAPGANLAAEVNVGERSWIGAGATVREQITIGSGVVVGAGAAVIRDVNDGMAVAGVPAVPIRSGARARSLQCPSH